MLQPATGKRIAAVLLAVALLFLALPLLPGWPDRTARADVTGNISRLSEWQRDFLRVISSLALKDAFDNHDDNGNRVFASVTAGQALYEGGWARYGISVVANNQYGIKAYNTWKGKVFDERTDMVYDSYETLAAIEGASYARDTSLWRAYDSWEESVADHSALFFGSKRFAQVLQATDYKDCARKIVESGYCSDNGYDRNLINVIESYGLNLLDDVTADEYGVVGLVMDNARYVLPIGESVSLTAQAYPEPVFPAPEPDGSENGSDVSGPDGGEPSGSESNESGSTEPGEGEIDEPEPNPEVNTLPVVWESNAPQVATVDENGTVTGLSQGIALITASYNGKEAACLVCVGTNAFVIDADSTLYGKSDSDSDSLGKVARGMPVLVLDSMPVTGADGVDYYAVRANTSNGKLQTGYLTSRRVYPLGRAVTSLHAETVVHMKRGDTRAVAVQIYPQSAENRTLHWKSSDPEVVSVSSDGVLTAGSKGTAIVTVTAEGGLSVQMIVNVDVEALTGITTTDLKLRENPDTDSDYYGIISGGTHVSVLRGPEDGWFYIQAEMKNNLIRYGYSLAQYIEVDGALPVGMGTEPDPDPVPEPPTVRKRSGYVNVDTVLNVRNSAGTTGSVVVQLPKKTEVVILGEDIYVASEKTYKNWYHISAVYNGKTYDGYAATDFIVVTGEIVDPEPEPDPEPVVSDYLTDDLYVWMIPVGTTVEEFSTHISLTVTVTDATGGEKEKTDLLATGDKAVFQIGSVSVYTKEIAVMGDMNGDGEVTASDYILLKRTCLQTLNPEGVYRRAGCFTDPTEISATDYLKAKRIVLGSFSLS